MVLLLPHPSRKLLVSAPAYPWNKPSCCPRCGGRLWWHGFVVAWFSCLFSLCLSSTSVLFAVPRRSSLKPTGILAPVSQFQC
ncbi:MAG: hypothetical protein JKP90_09830 [Desulfofustis sp. PB-SRB1]|nr:hypothetical protein [Desulfofustis sp. PB-SRB1]